MILTRKEREFIEDWLKVVDGEMDKLEFYRKWATRKDDRTFLDDYEAVKRGDMTLEEFRRKWSARGEWKTYIRVLKHRIEKKRKRIKRLLRELQEEARLINEFLKLEEWP